MTAMAEALAAAGVTSSRTRLRNVAIESLTANGGDWHAANRAMFRAVQNDAALLCVLFEKEMDRAVKAYLTEVKDQLWRDAKAKGRTSPFKVVGGKAPAKAEGGHGSIVSQSADAPLSQPNGVQPAAAPSGSGHYRHGNQSKDAQPAPISKPDFLTRNRAAIDAAQASCLNRFKVTVQGVEFSIGKVTPNQAATWARGRQRDARFVMHLTAGLPLNDPIEKRRTPQEAEEIWARVNREEGFHVA